MLICTPPTNRTTLKGKYMLLNVQAIILAAGKSSRFNTNKTKLTEKICGQPMVLYQIKVLEALNIPLCMVVGHQKELLISLIQESDAPNVSFVSQEIQQGTGDAVKCTQYLWQHDNILIMNGDIPLITPTIIEELYTKHTQSNAAITFVTAHDNNPNNSYGRVIQKNNSIEIIEAKHLANIQDHCCVNAGIYLAKRTFLEKYIETIQLNPITQEYYLTDLIKIANDNQELVETVTAPFDYVRGINTLEELWAAEQIKRSELIRNWMQQGVRFGTAQNVHIDLPVVIGAGSYIGSGVHLIGSTQLGANCTIHPFSILENSTLQDNVTVYSHSVIKDTHIKNNAEIGPFAHVRNHTSIGQEASIGNFVEIKNSSVGDQTKARHLTYLGDASVGDRVNIGAGTITANYDGVNKHQTIIQDHVSIGANNSIVAPVTIHHNACTAAGSTITENVPAYALAIGRSRQINKEEYVRHKEKKEKDMSKKTGESTDTCNAHFTDALKMNNSFTPSAE